MIYVKNTTDLFQITEEIKKNSWIYSQDGQELKFATGFLQKTKVVFLSVWNLTWFFEKLTDQAILNLFPDEIQPFILEIEKIQKSVSKTFSITNDDFLKWPPNFGRICNFKKIKEIIENSPEALDKANSIDKTLIDKKCIQIDSQVEKPGINFGGYMSEDKLRLLQQTSSVFRSAFIANKYFNSEKFGIVQVLLSQEELGWVYYKGEVKDGMPAGEGKIEATLMNRGTVIGRGNFVSEGAGLRYTKIIDGQIEYNYPNAEKTTITYENGEEINKVTGYSPVKRAVS